MVHRYFIIILIIIGLCFYVNSQKIILNSQMTVFHYNGGGDATGRQTHCVWSGGARHGRGARHRESALRQERQAVRRCQDRVGHNRINN